MDTLHPRVETSNILRVALTDVEARGAIEREGLDRLMPAGSIRGALASAAALAYVQLRAGRQVDASELLALCQREVPERAAVPIDVVVIDAVPLTAVGKIFKPALRLDAMRRAALKTVYATLGDAAPIRVDVRETEARPAVTLGVPSGPAAETLADSLRAAFAGYTFDTRILIGTPTE